MKQHLLNRGYTNINENKTLPNINENKTLPHPLDSQTHDAKHSKKDAFIQHHQLKKRQKTSN